MAKAVAAKDAKPLVVKDKPELPAPTGPTPATLMELALKSGAGIEQLEKLMELQEKWDKRQAKKAFFEALAKFQSIVPEIQKQRQANITSRKGEGSSFNYKYSDLGIISSTIKAAAFECGLSYRWEFEEINQKIKCTCLISHLDGHTETTAMEASKDNSGGKNDIQQIGSTQTYLQRYTLIGALGLTTADEDDDGKGSSQPKEEETRPQFLERWKKTVQKAKKQSELTALYLKNKKIVDGDDDLKQIFKDQEASFKPKPPAAGDPSTVNPQLP